MIELPKEEVQLKRERNPKKTSIKIVGMTCTSCANTIENALLRAEGVHKASVNFATETAYVEYDEAVTNEKELEKAIRDTGYDVFKGTQKITIRIGLMTCASCAQTIENSLP